MRYLTSWLPRRASAAVVVLALGSTPISIRAQTGPQPAPCPSIVSIQDLGYTGFIEYRDEDFRVLALLMLDTYPLSGWDLYWMGDYETVPDEPQNVFYTRRWVQALIETQCFNEPRVLPTGQLAMVTVVRESRKFGNVLPILGGGGGSGGGDPEEEAWYEWEGGVQYRCYNTNLDDGTRITRCDAV